MQLNLAHNALKKMPSGVPGKVIQLYLDMNRIDDIPKHVHLAQTALWLQTPYSFVLKLTRCEILKMFVSNLVDFFRDYFKDFTHLAFVRLNYNQLSDKGIPKTVFNVSTLLDLQLAHNQLTAIPFFNNHLEHLHLNHNSIESRLFFVVFFPHWADFLTLIPFQTSYKSTFSHHTLTSESHIWLFSHQIFVSVPQLPTGVMLLFFFFHKYR